jgi:hypothetical protein
MIELKDGLNTHKIDLTLLPTKMRSTKWSFLQALEK